MEEHTLGLGLVAELVTDSTLDLCLVWQLSRKPLSRVKTGSMVMHPRWMALVPSKWGREGRRPRQVSCLRCFTRHFSTCHSPVETLASGVLKQPLYQCIAWLSAFVAAHFILNEHH